MGLLCCVGKYERDLFGLSVHICRGCKALKTEMPSSCLLLTEFLVSAAELHR